MNPSCLLAYLGIRGYGTLDIATKTASKNALPVLAYYDIFKNFYANTQEENFYVIGNSENLNVAINGTQVNPNIIPSNEGRINNKGTIGISPNTIKQNELQIKVSKNSPTGQSAILTPGDIGTWLHNNRTKIGLNMAQVKLPQISVTLNSKYDTITTEGEQWNQVNPSCLLAYLGIRGFANMEGPTRVA